jgi:hypothetical protein
MLQVALGLAENPTLVEPDEKALKTASDFYANTLGVPAVSPNELIDFRTMLVKPKKWSTGSDSWTDGSGTPIPDVSNGGERNPMLSYYGNLSLTYRPIEARSDVERRFFLTFIDMEEGNYSPTMIKYRDQQLDSESKYELGRSQFLNYDTFFGEQVIRENTQRTNNPSAAVVETTDSTTGTRTANRVGQ